MTRPADVPAAIGWVGACNVGLMGGQISAVLRSWEDRFGALLMQMSFDTMSLQIAQSPPAEDELTVLGHEHALFCPDNITQGTDTLEAYLPQLSGKGWNFWWD